MKEEAKHLVGTHDFFSFCNHTKTESYADYHRTVQQINIDFIQENFIQISIQADRFLYKMARNIVGALVKSTSLEKLLQTPQKQKTYPTAPSHGLFLNKIYYNKL